MDYAQISNNGTSSRNKSPIYANRETRLYIIVNSETPIYMKVPIPPESMTLAQVKSMLPPQYESSKYYFRSHDPEFGEVNEEITDDCSKLPYEHDKIVARVTSSSSLNQDAILTMSPQSPTLRGIPPSVQSRSSNQDHDILYYHQNNSRDTYSLPRSITPRSLYYTNQFEALSPISRSVYDSVSSIPMRPLGASSLHSGRDHIQIIYSALKEDQESLDIRDREWLKMVIKDAFIGSSLVKWLSANVSGFSHKKDAKRYANRLLNLGFIRDPMGSGTFSEKCYYTLS